MIKINNFENNKNLVKLEQKGCFAIYEHKQDLSVSPFEASTAYFMQQMNFKKRQVLCTLNDNSVKIQAGAMQWTAGNVESKTGVKNIGGFLKGALKGAVTGESALKPVYNGNGYLMLEPTFKYLMIEDIASWGDAGVVMQDGLFLACESSVNEKVIARSSLSSALAGGEGLFNLCLSGSGLAVFESPVPRDELYEIELDNDVCKIDGNMAIAWSASLKFTVERSSKSLLGSALNGEGLVNVYRGSGKIWFCPTIPGTLESGAYGVSSTKAKKGIVGNILNKFSGS